MKKIVLVSPFPPTQNPRLVKEYKSLKKVGYDVRVIYAARDKWSSGHYVNKDFVLVAGKHGSLLHLFSRLIHKISKFCLPPNLTYHRATLFLLYAAIKNKADLYIGHDLTSLPIVAKVAKRNQAKCGFDAEDFHRHEMSDDMLSPQYLDAKKIEDQYIYQMNYFSCASPLIAKQYQSLYPNLNPIVINNVFSSKLINSNINEYTNLTPLKLFWFSQSLGKNRGIETLLEAIRLVNNPTIKLTLLGYRDEITDSYFRNYIKSLGLLDDQVTLMDPVCPEELFEIAKSHHIGLALEPGFSKNNHIALSNKLFTYLTSGLAVIATETDAQKKFMTENDGVGKSFQIGNVDQLMQIIETYLSHSELLNQHRHNAIKSSQIRYNWEEESKLLLQVINKTIQG